MTVAGIGVALFTLLPASGFADEFTTFDFGESSTPTAFGNFQAQHDVRPGSGLINLYASAVVSGGADVVGRIGATYTLNSGDLLSSFTAFTSTKGTAVGELTCLNIATGTVASLNLEFQKWHQVGENWNLEESVFVDEWRCPLVTLVDFEPFSGGSNFSYEPGETYRLVVEALAQSRAVDGSEAITDFCDTDALSCGAFGIPGHILVDLIKVLNQRPIALFHDSEVWYVDALLNGAVVTGRSCDVDGTVEEITVWISELLTQTVTTVGSVCGDGHHGVIAPAPGTFTGNAEGRDDEGAVGRDVGIFRVSLLPPVQSLPAGFPDLGAFRPIGTATLQTWLDAEGKMKAYRLAMDGLVVADTSMASLQTAHLATITYDLAGGTASVVLDDEERWRGAVAPPGLGANWWDIEPVTVPPLVQL